MTQQTLYSLRTDGTQYRITKFVDGGVDSSYLTNGVTCECPAGVRPTCRHRQMLPQMLAHGLVDTHWFWDFDRGYACDFQGGSKQLADQVANASRLAEVPAEEDTITQPHSPMATTADFDFADAGSIPAGVAKPQASHKWRRF